VAWLFAAAGVWHLILGVDANSSIEIAAAVGFTFFGAGLPLSLGARVLQGLGRNHVAVSLQALQALTALAVVALAATFAAPFWVFVAGPFLGTFIVAATSWTLAQMSLQRMSVMGSRVEVADSPPRAIALYAVPMVIIALAEPVAWQADRIILSHAATLTAVAQYSLVFALFGPLNSLIAASGGSLWPIFARRRTLGNVTRGDVARTTAGFTGIGLLLSASLIVLGPVLVRFMARGAVVIPSELYWAFACVLLLIAMWIPTGMVLTNPTGLRVQAGLVIGQVVLNIPLSIALASRLGAVGPVIASVLAITVGNLVGWAYFLRSSSN
jgi:O-antigen/teichoic acid export membrane protein